MPGLVTRNDRLVTHDGRPVTHEFQAMADAAGPTPAERRMTIARKGRSLAIPRWERVV